MSKTKFACVLLAVTAGFAAPPAHADLIGSTPQTILSFSGSGFDATRVENPSVTYANGMYTMLYMAGGFSNNEEIGEATSLDGISWTTNPSNPVISNSGSPSWDSFREIPATLLYGTASSKYLLYFNGDNSNLDSDPGYAGGFGYATSTDGIDWTQPANPIRDRLFDSPNGEYVLDTVVDLNGTYDAYYSTTAPGDPQYVATSTDGINFGNDTPIALAGYKLDTATTTTINGIDTIFSIWTGSNGDYYYATSTDGVNFTVDGEVDYSPSSFEIDSILIVDDQIDFYGTVDVGNVNWCCGNEVIDYATASLPALPEGVPEPGSWSLLVAGAFGLVVMRRRLQPTSA